MLNENAIITNNLTKFYGETRAIDGLNLEIPFGKIFGLVGPNGAGKTTLIRLLSGILLPTAGNAKIFGYDIIMDNIKIKKIIGLLPQTPAIYNKLTAREFLTFVGELYNLSKDIILSRIDELLALFDLEKRENSLLEGYSRGMKQKICFSAALIHNPEILLLDEPLSNLDPSSTILVKDIILNLKKKSNKTILLSTNILSIAEELCDLVGIIDNGIMKEIGTPNEIINNNSAKNLEEVYLKIIFHPKDKKYISW